MTPDELNKAVKKIQTRFDAVNHLFIKKIAVQIAKIGEL